jgi:hypothetical protein
MKIKYLQAIKRDGGDQLLVSYSYQTILATTTTT